MHCGWKMAMLITWLFLPQISQKAIVSMVKATVCMDHVWLSSVNVTSTSTQGAAFALPAVVTCHSTLQKATLWEPDVQLIFDYSRPCNDLSVVLRRVRNCRRIIIIIIIDV